MFPTFEFARAFSKDNQ